MTVRQKISNRCCIAKPKRLGFTLIEVLVAMAVIGFTIPAIMLLMVKQTDYAGVLRDKAMAQWVADNKMVELHHNRIHHNVLPEREEVESVDMAGRKWELTTNISKAEIWVKYSIAVGLEEEAPITTLDTYLHSQ